jgi:hypothetical protein
MTSFFMLKYNLKYNFIIKFLKCLKKTPPKLKRKNKINIFLTQKCSNKIKLFFQISIYTFCIYARISE